MKHIRTITGAVALITFAVSLNLMVWQREALMPVAWGLLITGFILGVIWIVQVVLGLTGGAGRDGWAAGGLNAAVSSLFFLGICIVIYVLFAGWDASWDLTQEGRRKLAPQTIQVLRSMNQQVEVTCFFLKVDDELVWIAQDKTLRFLEQCQQYTGLLNVEVLDPQIDMHRLEALQISRASTQGTIVLHAGDRKRVITLTGGSPRLQERDFTNALINVLRDRELTVGFLTGHKERRVDDDRPGLGASAFGNLLAAESYEVKNVAIQLSDPEVPAECDILVINNPLGDLYAQDIKAIDAFLEGGGRLLVLLEPWESVTSAAGEGERMRPWLEERFGIKVGSDMVITKEREGVASVELRNNDAPFEDVDEGFMQFAGSFNKEHGITQGFDQVMLLQTARSVSISPLAPGEAAVSELIRTTPDYWAETDLRALKQQGQASKHEEEQGGPISLAAASVRRSETLDDTGQPLTSRVVVVGDADFAVNGQLESAEIPGNLNFLLNVIAWLGERQDLIAIRPSGKSDPPLVLSPPETRAIVWVSTLLTLQLVVVAGLVVYVLRRKHR